MKKNYFILLLLIAIASLIYSIYSFSENKKQKNEIANLNSEIKKLNSDVYNLKSEINELENKNSDLDSENSELREQLADVKHFDNNIYFRSGYSSGGGGISYTGSVIETQIDGDFEGWEGETIFKLMDGSIWQQASYDYTYHYAYSPDVMIYSKGGMFYMKVEGVDDEIMVRRIR